jgi:hypothetical protein
MTSSLGSTFWHDGQLHRLAFEMDAEGTALVKLSLSLYDDEQSPKRNQVTVVGVRVSRFETTLDVAELKNNVRAGNIADGRIENGMLSLELTGGRVEIEAKEFRANAV